MTDRSTWKKFEQRVARFFGSTRAPLSGRNNKITGSDSLHPALFIECKLRAESPIHKLFAETQAKAQAEGKTPLLALQWKNHAGWLLVCRPEDIHLLASFAKNCSILPPYEDGTTADETQ